MIYIKNAGKAYNRKTLIKYFIKEKPASYSDEACTVEQCRAGAFRSVSEILEMTRTYYPKTSLEGVLRIIKELIESGEPVALIWCTQVKKVVLKYMTSQQREFITQYSKSNHYNKKGLDGYSIQDYETILNNL